MIPWLQHIRRITGGLILIGAALLAWLHLSEKSRSPTVTHTGTPAVTLSYLLTDAAGRTISEHTFRGRPVVYLFGWASDPDLTPAAVQVLGSAVTMVRTRDLVPVFITLDPARDTPAKLADLVHRSPFPIVAATGGEADIARLARDARLYVRRVDDTAAPGGYRIEHTLAYLVVGRDGRFAGVVPYETSPAAVAAAINLLIP